MLKKINPLGVWVFVFVSGVLGFLLLNGDISESIGKIVFAEDNFQNQTLNLDGAKKIEEQQVAETMQPKIEEQKTIDIKSETTASPKVGDQKTVEIITKSDDSKKVEYYIQSKDVVVTKPEERKKGETQYTPTKNYLGTAENKTPGKWNLTVDTEKQLPNGEYQITPRLYKKDGSIIDGKKTALTVNIPIETLSSEEKTKFKNSDTDTDGDSVPDKEEIRLGTNPLLADSDGDGFLDGDEVKNGFNPLKFSPGDKSDKVIFESPKAVVTNNENISVPAAPAQEKITDTRFVVNSVDVIAESTSKDATKKGARFSGKALPNIFVTLYIYSDPIIVTVKTDAEGNWSYDLDKELPDGNHEVYVAVTDNVGKITSQSRALPFVKTADAIAIQPVAASTTEAAQNASPLEQSQTRNMIIAFIVIMSAIGIALVIIGRKSFTR